jgi:hypothetical protein
VSAFAAPSSAAAPATAGLNAKFGWVSNATLAAHPALRQTLHIPTATERSSSQRFQSETRPLAIPASSKLHCNGILCAQVTGTGLKVTKIYTTLEGDFGCINAQWLAVKGTDYGDGDILRSATGSEVCAEGDEGSGGTYYYTFDNQVPDRMPYTFPSEGTLGVFWTAGGKDLTFDIHK